VAETCWTLSGQDHWLVLEDEDVKGSIPVEDQEQESHGINVRVDLRHNQRFHFKTTSSFLPWCTRRFPVRTREEEKK
jgi:hypothetical protein